MVVVMAGTEELVVGGTEVKLLMLDEVNHDSVTIEGEVVVTEDTDIEEEGAGVTEDMAEEVVVVVVPGGVYVE